MNTSVATSATAPAIRKSYSPRYLSEDERARLADLPQGAALDA